MKRKTFYFCVATLTFLLGITLDLPLADKPEPAAEVIIPNITEPAVNAQDKWQVADETTVRLKPAVFLQLPEKIVSYLEARDCTVPQSFGAGNPHNVIRGQFAK